MYDYFHDYITIPPTDFFVKNDEKNNFQMNYVAFLLTI